MQPWHADAVVVRHPRHAHHLQIGEGRGGRVEGGGQRARHDRPGDIRRHEAGRRVRLRAQPGRRAEHRERADVSQDAGRLRGLQRFPPLRRLLRVQGDGRGQEDAGAVGARASGFPGPDRGGQRRDQVPPETARHELRVQGVRGARPRASALRAPLLRAVGRRRGRRPREKKRGPWRPEEQAFLQLRLRLPLLLPVRKSISNSRPKLLGALKDSFFVRRRAPTDAVKLCAR